MRALIYSRVSTDAQERDGTSLDTQERACLEHAQSSGWRVVECALGHDPRDRTDIPTTAECGGTSDSDSDGLLNAWEMCKWGTDDTVIDTDGDGTGDCVEAADVNGDGIVDFVGDTIAYAKAALLATSSFGQTMDFDINGDGIVDFVGDVIQEAKFALGAELCL